MSEFVARDPVLDGFSGMAPLFPLPNVVLFPHALLPLHIFEPRYRQMTADALDGEQLIAMALLKSGKGSPPPIHDVVGLGKIIAQERLPDGRYHLVLRGIARARVIREPASDRMYRLGELLILEETTPPAEQQQVSGQTLVKRFERSFPAVREHPVWQAVASSDVPLGVVCDLLASALPIAPEFAQRFLADLDVGSRCRALFAVLDQIEGRKASEAQPVRSFPPAFSAN
ncbi:MAG: LON peptidase substrate-binding domain-containing protein [Planctomycetaceae bacterium]|nr:LON peptidase substrate-binding domain-containing protein [Planctomycetaceae bacterium]